jgi:hypothetical protein
VLEIGDGVFEVKATNGDTHLGGDDWDNTLMDWILDEFKKESGMDLRKQPDALQRIKEEAEKAKIALPQPVESQLHPPLHADPLRLVATARLAPTPRPRWDSRWGLPLSGHAPTGLFAGPDLIPWDSRGSYHR